MNGPIYINLKIILQANESKKGLKELDVDLVCTIKRYSKPYLRIIFRIHVETQLVTKLRLLVEVLLVYMGI